ncbi:hypothetical protein F7731_16685 [Cytobacillus depressus]|uniref:Uncharacterized protein n=1 Tax=Cytobacillus depressus TaxID=1602942 RepID=A0A6L3V7R2_9BACI|nr:hypothetical protein [Cytobacillus depressus]KAB2333193.1 hypothetical protein F7731_16685 [Cytobacillus depressus]
MRWILIVTATIAIVVGFFYLYQRQLGAIAFFLTSIYFFSLAYSLLSKKAKNSIKNEKEKERKI